MAKKKDKHDQRMMVDERIIAHTSEFFSKNAVKFVLAVVLLAAVVVVWTVWGHIDRSREREVGNYLEDNFYALLGSSPEDGEDAQKIDVDEVLAKTKDTKIRPSVLYTLAQYLFNQGGDKNLRRAEEVARQLRDEYPDVVWYQTRADELIRKAIEEREFVLPTSDVPIGPEKGEEPEEKAEGAEPAEKAEGAEPAEKAEGAEPAEKAEGAEPAEKAEGTTPASPDSDKPAPTGDAESSPGKAPAEKGADPPRASEGTSAASQ